MGIAILILGLLLWTSAHIYKRAFPANRAALTERLGEGPAKGVFALLLAVALVLMIWGYRSAEYVHLYSPPGWATHVNNLGMIFAIALLGAGNSKGRIRTWFRHPMLTGVVIWGIVHLMVNGHLAALILFGGLTTWASFHMAIINQSEGAWQRPEPGPISGDVRLIVIALVLYGVISAIHIWLGVWPFPR